MVRGHGSGDYELYRLTHTLDETNRLLGRIVTQMADLNSNLRTLVDNLPSTPEHPGR